MGVRDRKSKKFIGFLEGKNLNELQSKVKEHNKKNNKDYELEAHPSNYPFTREGDILWSKKPN